MLRSAGPVRIRGASLLLIYLSPLFIFSWVVLVPICDPHMSTKVLETHTCNAQTSTDTRQIADCMINALDVANWNNVGMRMKGYAPMWPYNRL